MEQSLLSFEGGWLGGWVGGWVGGLSGPSGCRGLKLCLPQCRPSGLVRRLPAGLPRACTSRCPLLPAHPNPSNPATYPTWEPDAAGQQLLQQVATAPAASLVPGGGQHPLAWSLLPHVAPPAPAGLLQRRQAGLAAAALQPRKALAAALAGGRRGSGAGAGVDSSGIFGSADLTAAAREEAALAAAASADAHLDAVSASQLLLQSLYEQRRCGGEAAAGDAPPPPQPPQPPPQPPPALQPQGSHPLAPAPSAQQPQAQRSFAALQAPMPIPRTTSTTSGRSAGTSPLHALLASPSPQQRVLQQAAGAAPAAAASPRQPWLGRSPSGRARVAELSVLSRENSAASAAAPSPQQPPPPPAANGGSGALLGAPHRPAAALVEAPGPDTLLGLAHELPRSGGTSAPSEELSESLLLHQLQGSQQGSGLRQSGGSPGSPGSSDCGPPEFF